MHGFGQFRKIDIYRKIYPIFNILFYQGFSLSIMKCINLYKLTEAMVRISYHFGVHSEICKCLIKILIDKKLIVRMISQFNNLYSYLTNTSVPVYRDGGL